MKKIRWDILSLLAFLALLLSAPWMRAPSVHAQSSFPIQNSIINQAPGSLAYTQAFDYDGSGNCIYIGMARSSNSGGPSLAAAFWSIKKVTYNGSNQATLVQWANGSTSEVNIWNNRASLTYQ